VPGDTADATTGTYSANIGAAARTGRTSSTSAGEMPILSSKSTDERHPVPHALPAEGTAARRGAAGRGGGVDGGGVDGGEVDVFATIGVGVHVDRRDRQTAPRVEGPRGEGRGRTSLRRHRHFSRSG
jgi:hypothetical protein